MQLLFSEGFLNKFAQDGDVSMFFYIQDEIMIQVDVNVNIASMHDKLEI
jgi:hypothetical protein